MPRDLNKTLGIVGNGVFLAGILMGLTACAVGPDYKSPDWLEDVASKGAIHQAQGVMGDGEKVAAGPQVKSESVWAKFSDETLQALLTEALAHNADVSIAMANLNSASTFVRDAFLDRVPQPLTTLGATEQEDSQTQSFSQNQTSGKYQDYQIRQSFNWEIDLVGRLKRLNEGARAGMQIQADNLAHVKILTQAAVVEQYFLLRGTQAQLSATRENAKRQHETWRLTQSRLDAGVATPIDVQRAKSQYYATLAGVPPLAQQVKRAQHRLAVLTGRGTWQSVLPALEVETPMPGIPASMQWDITAQKVLQGRPDILAVEQAVKQATANIGVAKAQWFPKISFLADVGFASENLDDLTDSDSVFSLLGVNIQWAGLGISRVNNRVKRAEIAAELAHAEYKKVVLLAFEEVENALGNYQSTQAITEHLRLSAQAAQKAAELAQARYEGGVIGFIEVLDAEKRQLDIETQLALAKTQEAVAVVTLLKSAAMP